MPDIKPFHHLAHEIATLISDAIEDQTIEIDDENMTDFMHALANVAPTMIFNGLTGANKNHLEFNHIANQLCFQYMDKPE